MSVLDRDAFFTFEGRLASFKKTTKKRGSTAGGRGGKALNWPHKQITPASLAKAGFFYNPSAESLDNVECFLCKKGLDGWESGDDPLREHLTHASHCGWAVLAAIEAEVEEYATQDPTEPNMVEARQATFAGKWPHEGKNGWVCKTQQLVDAGWKYTPTPESDDMATCAYCQLALDGWEPSDEPYDEHYKRSPNCAFFALGGLAQSPLKKSVRGKTTQVSKPSRISTQSAATMDSDATAVADETAGPDDSVMTTASTMTQGGTKKPRAKKAAASKSAKGGKKKAKKSEQPPTKEEERKQEPEQQQEQEESIATAPPPAKSTRGRKRGSAAVDDSVMTTTSEAPEPKRRATKKRGSVMTNTSIVTDDTEMTEVQPEPKTTKRKAGRPSKARKVSTASIISTASTVATPEDFPDDDEIERQLEADLERQVSEDEPEESFVSVPPKSKSKTQKAKPKPKSNAKTKKNGKTSPDFAMFDPNPTAGIESDVDDELEALQQQMEVDAQLEVETEPTPQKLIVTKKGRAAATASSRKVSKQTAKPPKPKSPSPPVYTEETDEDVPESVSYADDNESENNDSDNTVIRDTSPVPVTSSIRGSSRARQDSVASVDSVNIVTYVEPEETPEPEEEQEENLTQRSGGLTANNLAVVGFTSSPAPRQVVDGYDPTTSEFEAAFGDEDDIQVAEDPIQSSPVRSVAERPYTPEHETQSILSPVTPARQPVLSPSQSPQSSDAENQPPSTTTKRTALVAKTPSRAPVSPSKRNVIAGLTSNTTWTAANLDDIFGTPKVGIDKENAGTAVERLLRQGKDLSAEEKSMTVEQWIYFNAGEAEKRLRYECERMVSRFEGEGTRAIRVLEGLAVE